jgi:predicted enzyme related to lactoylglutathione lyase
LGDAFSLSILPAARNVGEPASSPPKPPTARLCEGSAIDEDWTPRSRAALASASRLDPRRAGAFCGDAAVRPTRRATRAAPEIQEIEMPLALNRLILYARDVEGTVAFYEKHFGFRRMRMPGDRIVELVAQSGGANIMVHAAAKGVRTGQVTVKLVFDVEDVAGFCARSAGDGLVFGAEHLADGYSYANAKDPCGNNIQVSSRAFRKAD